MRKISLLLFFISIFGYSEFNNNNLKEKEVLVAISRVVKKKKYDFSDTAYVEYYDYGIEESAPDKLIFDDSFDYDKFSRFSNDSFKFSINKAGGIEIINSAEKYGELNTSIHNLSKTLSGTSKDNYDGVDENYNALKIKVNLKEITNFRNALYNGGAFKASIYLTAYPMKKTLKYENKTLFVVKREIKDENKDYSYYIYLDIPDIKCAYRIEDSYIKKMFPN
ncbi:conserved hypothetical protein (plasmid) [Borreliella afzelii PKo]|uniref:Uncharacterized protein n=1 Tax=Borreliella afzelii (strain PKo) TaxID=390236 RepID=G0IT73_BORAP|nr:conserved hypothetical protein [Borreliella afzelii PKo]